MLNKHILSKAAQIAALMVAGAAAPAFADSAAPAPVVTDAHFTIAPGYLKPADLPNSLDLLGPPPAAGSAALARDEEARQSTVPLRGGDRWKQAILDADLVFPQPADNFSCALGVQIDETNTPRLFGLMKKMMSDAGLSTYGVKNKYNRTRPFVVHSEGTCTPDQEAILHDDGSYPSGHTAAGFAWALALSEIAPERANELLARGIAFGQSRIVCNAHWQSDVDGGRIMGAATVARLHADPVFVEDLRVAGEEIAKARANGLTPKQDCAAEAKALATQ
ncbi:acid phosphatase [Kaistia sp. 32K]|uniref:acid phosphatase n=1 Tax=Kaistia sp. 32K TaxID=2795690 RepID=UPI001935FC88|nr:phosphatase PAP2 family protein [Kaistia sp. 32K]BCP55181.1 acid phosphatase [Kaistia sp. 32K]